MKKKNIIILSIIILILCFAVWQYQIRSSRKKLTRERDQVIEAIIDAHRPDTSSDLTADPFADDGIVKILLIGLDARIGEENGHCDAIQLITIDKNNTGNINITAVPRGTYSPLPIGKGTTSSDYYVSNACGFGGLEYGIKQIEKILDTKADYLVVVGFSQTMGILRNLDLPTTETLQWLRNRHGYTIGEPQRAHNHSTFIKEMMIKFIPTKKTVIDTPLQYILYKIVKTDLSFSQVENIIDIISDMDIANHPEKIKLSMRPFYPIADIVYDPDTIKQHLDETLGSIKQWLSKDDYSNMTKEDIQEKILKEIEENKTDPEFLSWAYKNSLWLQIEDNEKSLAVQYDLFISYLASLTDEKERESVIAEYIIEMENRGETIWQERAKNLLIK